MIGRTGMLHSTQATCLQIGAIFGAVILSGCGPLQGPPIQPTAPQPAPAPVDSFVRPRPDDSTSHAFSQLGLAQFVFDFAAPKDAQCTVWMKTYVDGKLDRQLCHIEKRIPGSGDSLSGQIHFNRYDPSAITETPSTKARWYFGMTASASKWVDDPFKSTDTRTSTP